MDKRSIVLKDFNGVVIREMDISDIDHANTQLDMTIVVRTRCDMGDWHEGQSVRLFPWGQRVHDTTRLCRV